jgi:hypothetical protein
MFSLWTSYQSEGQIQSQRISQTSEGEGNVVTKAKITGSQKKGNVKVGKLKLTKETLKDLTRKEQSLVKGGAVENTKKRSCVIILCTLSK